MRVSSTSLLYVAALAVSVALVLVQRYAAHGSADSTQTLPPDVRELATRQPVAFVPNLGQWEHPARYVARVGGTSVFLEERGFLLGAVERPASAKRDDRWPREPWDREPPENENLRGAAVRLAFANAGTPELVPEHVLAGHHDYFLGNDPARWRTEVPLYGAVRYRAAWPGVEVLCYAQDSHLEYDVVVAPGGDLARVEITVEGGKGMSIEADGALVIETAMAPLRQPRPTTFTLDATGARRPLNARYELRGQDRFGFVVPEWRGAEELIVDPGLIWSTYVGAAGRDRVADVALDSAGTITIAGSTLSVGFPTSVGAWSTAYNLMGDGFVTRIDPARLTAQQLVYSTFVGGQDSDAVVALSIDNAGRVTVCGQTGSSGFPTTPNAWSRVHAGGFRDVFLVRLDPSQPGVSQLVYSTLVGGALRDEPAAMSVDGAVVTLAGMTTSSDYPVTANAWDTSHNGGPSLAPWDGFLTQIDIAVPPAQQVVYSSFLGGGDIDTSAAVSVGATGIVTVGGTTRSLDFPTTASAWNVTHNNNPLAPGDDVFLTLVDPAAPVSQQLLYSTFFGGDGRETLGGFAVDAGGVITLVGATTSSGPLFPTTPNAWDRLKTGPTDCFLARLDPYAASSQLLYSTFLGGRGDESAFGGVSLDSSGVVTICGWTTSPNYPTTPGAWDRMYAGGVGAAAGDAFVTRLDPSRPPLRQLLYSTLLGGQDYDAPLAHALALGFVVTAGLTRSPDFATTAGAWGRVQPGADDGFVSILDMLPTGVTLFGDSSPGCNGPLGIGVTSMPNVGNQGFSITCTSAPPNAQGWLLGAAAGLTTPTPVLGALLWIDPNRAFRVTAAVRSNNVGAAEVVLPIPANQGLAGFRLYTQFAWLGPNAPAPCPFTGVSASAALEIVVQP